MNESDEARRGAGESDDAARRKALGQFFTSPAVSRLLAHLALEPGIETVLDPMAGVGDLLDATIRAARERGVELRRVDGVEIDPAAADTCRRRLLEISQGATVRQCRIVAGDAFDPDTYQHLGSGSYDLVITNPPFIRYQAPTSRNRYGRDQLVAIVGRSLSSEEREVWETLVNGYSGLADLSVPSVILAGALVRPGGRLALVMPATWRSREYGDVVRYLFLRCFRLEAVIEDTYPGWFSGALVRTQLIVARRRLPEEALVPLSCRTDWSSTLWVRISSDAASRDSLVGGAFEDSRPELAFVQWLERSAGDSRVGLEVRKISLADEWFDLLSRQDVVRKKWFRRLEGAYCSLPLFSVRDRQRGWIPDVLSDIVSIAGQAAEVASLLEAGIQVGQGLRTGCNKFFYVTETGREDDEFVRIRTSDLFKCWELKVPADALRPVLHRQSDMWKVAAGQLPDTRVLDLRGWVLPEDFERVLTALSRFKVHSIPVPKIMPDPLASFVRMAARTPVRTAAGKKLIPELSAVRTNVRAKERDGIPRFWYMLPDFTDRHLPDVFVPRIIHEIPTVEANMEPPILIDANFSTLWTIARRWSRFALKALLNSTWCRACMEALGTPLGGGALKLEASHLKRIPVPKLTDELLRKLDALGRANPRDRRVQVQIDLTVLEGLFPGIRDDRIVELTRELAARSEQLRSLRRRTRGNEC